MEQDLLLPGPVHGVPLHLARWEIAVEPERGSPDREAAEDEEPRLHDDGIVVGRAVKELVPDSEGGFNEVRVGAVWVGGAPQDVNDLIPDEVFSGTLSDCRAINDEGQIVCQGNGQVYLVSGLTFSP